MWNGGYFGSIPTIRGMMPKAHTSDEKLRNRFLTGTIGGLIGTVLNTPADVVRRVPVAS